MQDRMERYIESVIRAENEDGRTFFSGRAITYDTLGFPYPNDPDGFEEVIRRGALLGADKSDVVLTINHSATKIPLARTRNGRGTMQLFDVPEGLDFKAEVDMENNATVREVRSAIDRGDLWGMSFIAIADPADILWSDVDGRPHAEITRFTKLLEISIVTRPAYKDTRVVSRSEAEALAGLAEARKIKVALDIEKARNVIRSKI